jgi:RNA polymerase sigma-70 factor, ECF subfamily
MGWILYIINFGLHTDATKTDKTDQKFSKSSLVVLVAGGVEPGKHQSSYALGRPGFAPPATVSVLDSFFGKCVTFAMAIAPGLTPELLDEFSSLVANADVITLRGMLPAVYDDLRRVAAGFLRDEKPGHTLQATALVHEAYLRMADQRQSSWQNRAHLLAVFARMMRRILIDHAGARQAAKRGGKEAVRITLDDELEICSHEQVDVLELNDALSRLERLDPMQARIVEMRFFGGLTIEETAEALDMSPTSVKREWSFAKRWLRREIGPR